MRNHRLGLTSRLQQRCDKEFSRLVREKEICEKCGVRGVDFDTAHIIGRKNLTLRWDILNVFCFCRECHMWAHANPTKFIQWIKSKYPERMDYVDSYKNRILKRTTEDYKFILEAIREKNFKHLIMQTLD